MDVAQDVAGALSVALVKAINAKGVVLAIAMADDSIWFHSAGDLCVKLGLTKALELNARELFKSTDEEEDDE